MLIRFVKPRSEDRQPTFTVLREDGTTTGQPSSSFFVAHDLTHFAVESFLGYVDAFYGLLNQGLDIDAFAERAPGTRKAPRLPDEAHIAEVLVGLLDLQRAQRTVTDAEIIEHLRRECASRSVATPPIGSDEIGQIRKTRDALLKKWSDLPAGEILELTFSPQNAPKGGI